MYVLSKDNMVYAIFILAGYTGKYSPVYLELLWRRHVSASRKGTSMEALKC